MRRTVADVLARYDDGQLTFLERTLGELCEAAKVVIASMRTEDKAEASISTTKGVSAPRRRKGELGDSLALPSSPASTLEIALPAGYLTAGPKSYPLSTSRPIGFIEATMSAAFTATSSPDTGAGEMPRRRPRRGGGAQRGARRKVGGERAASRR
jgi:hypothetical protein